jgi:hypothetical protein
MIELNTKNYNNTDKYIWVNNKKLALLNIYRILDKDYFLCIRSDYILELIDTENDVYYEDTKEVRKGMKELNKKTLKFKDFKDRLFKKLLKHYRY